jgi:hypothetical protein
MRWWWMSLLAASSLAAEPFSAQDLDVAAQLRDRGVEGRQAHALVTSLTTDVGHRMAGTENDAKGVRWAVAQFKALGYDRVYTQPVSFPVWDRGFESAAILAPNPAPLNVTALGGSIGTPKGGVRAAVVAFADIAALEKAAPGSLRGKIAYVGNRMQRARDGSGYGPAVLARVQGAVYAARAGAAAILIRSIGTDDQARTPHTGTMRYDNTLTRIPAAALGQIDADQLEAALATGETIVELNLGSRVRIGYYTSANVIGEVRGSEQPDEVVVIGGHLDSWDLGVGALDNGAGVAITMTAGALIAQLDERPERTVRVIAFANEEQGIWGGRAYAASQQSAIAQHIIGAESDFGAGRIYRMSTRVRSDALPIVAAMHQVLAPLGIELGANDATGGADLSALRDAGMPLLGLNQDGTQYFDYHHTSADTLDKIRPGDLDFNAGVYAAMAYLAAQAGPVFGPVPKPEAPN